MEMTVRENAPGTASTAVNNMKRARREPNFFIVGAAKSGTSSIADNIGQHPDVFMSPAKEPFYFVSDYGFDDFDEYLALFRRAGGAKAIGEASTGYLFDERAPHAIHERFPGARIIIVLRDPVEMAYSYWRYMHIIGNESKSFEEAISDRERSYRKTGEFRRKALNWWASYIYLERAMYCGQVKRYLDVFGRDRVRVYIFEEFFRDQSKSYRDLFAFLGVDVNFTPDGSIKNEGGAVRYGFLKDIVNSRYPVLKRLVPMRLREKIRMELMRLNTKRSEKTPMNPETRRHLEGYFRQDIRDLEGLLGRRIKAWDRI